jgi:hypothetical protein
MVSLKKEKNVISSILTIFKKKIERKKERKRERERKGQRKKDMAPISCPV